MSTSEVVSLIQKDSLEMNNADREAVRLAVNETIEDMIVVTHSTDTITNTDKVLSDIPDKTIVITGTLSPATIYTLRRYVQYR
jgi:L-asparaginase